MLKKLNVSQALVQIYLCFCVGIAPLAGDMWPPPIDNSRLGQVDTCGFLNSQALQAAQIFSVSFIFKRNVNSRVFILAHLASETQASVTRAPLIGSKRTAQSDEIRRLLLGPARERLLSVAAAALENGFGVDRLKALEIIDWALRLSFSGVRPVHPQTFHILLARQLADHNFFVRTKAAAVMRASGYFPSTSEQIPQFLLALIENWSFYSLILNELGALSLPAVYSAFEGAPLILRLKLLRHLFFVYRSRFFPNRFVEATRQRAVLQLAPETIRKTTHDVIGFNAEESASLHPFQRMFRDLLFLSEFSPSWLDSVKELLIESVENVSPSLGKTLSGDDFLAWALTPYMPDEEFHRIVPLLQRVSPLAARLFFGYMGMHHRTATSSGDRDDFKHTYNLLGGWFEHYVERREEAASLHEWVDKNIEDLGLFLNGVFYIDSARILTEVLDEADDAPWREILWIALAIHVQGEKIPAFIRAVGYFFGDQLTTHLQAWNQTHSPVTIRQFLSGNIKADEIYSDGSIPKFIRRTASRILKELRKVSCRPRAWESQANVYLLPAA